jgi:hypothetical protein
VSEGPKNGKTLGPAFIPGPAEEAKREEVAEQGVRVDGRGEPVFEVIIPSTLVGVNVPLHHFKFWADGWVEGFEGVAPQKSVIVVNRFPMAIANIMAPLREYVEQVEAMNAELAKPQGNVQRQADGHD